MHIYHLIDRRVLLLLICNLKKKIYKEEIINNKEMKSWNDLLEYDETVVSTAIGRKKEIELLYKNNSEDNRRRFIQNIKNFMDDYYITLNNYPYDISYEIVHLIFWYSNKNTMSFKEVKLICSEIFCTHKDNIIIFSNDQKTKSIPEINHYHVFLRKT